MIDYYLVLFLTVSVILLNLYACLNSYKCALYLERGGVWDCRSLNLNCAVKILVVHGTLSLSLVILKTWAVFDVFLTMWYEMPHTYHIRSYAFLSENAGVALLGILIVNFIKTTGSSCE